jgi:chromosome segregation ATPase
MKCTLPVKALAVLLTLALAPMPRALAADSTNQAQEVKAKIDSVRTEVAKVRNQVALTLEELNRLRNDNIDLRTQFQVYSQELGKMEQQANVARDRAARMGQKGQDYFQAWEDTIKSISNEDIRAQAQKRYDKRVSSYNEIVKAMTAARDELKPFMSDLNDIKTMLDSELSRESVKSASNLIKQANWHGAEVVDSLKDVEKELDRVSGEMAKYE